MKIILRTFDFGDLKTLKDQRNINNGGMDIRRTRRKDTTSKQVGKRFHTHFAVISCLLILINYCNVRGISQREGIFDFSRL